MAFSDWIGGYLHIIYSADVESTNFGSLDHSSPGYAGPNGYPCGQRQGYRMTWGNCRLAYDPAEDRPVQAAGRHHVGTGPASPADELLTVTQRLVLADTALIPTVPVTRTVLYPRQSTTGCVTTISLLSSLV
ncbi:hypothetical protein CHU98_g12018 [Xylaria longipes]|nr:hypothetical protein CHU98_g12018 [Xylaria longipes]